MAYPDDYTRSYSFTAFQQAQGDNSFPGTQIDNEFDEIHVSIDEILDYLALLGRSDGHLTNAIVTWDSLSAEVKAKFQTGGAAPGEPVDPAVVYAGPTSGPDALPVFRALATTDLPLLDQGVAGATPVSLWTRARGAPQFEDFGLVDKTMADLRRVLGPVDKAQITIKSYHATGGAGGGLFWWDAASTDADNGGTVILPTGHVGAGRWKRAEADDEPFDITWFGAKGDARVIAANASITSGAAALTISTASFTADDVGKVIGVPGAGVAGAMLTTTISVFTSSTQVTLGAAASTTLAAAAVTIPVSTDDTNAIMAAIDASMPLGKFVRIPKRSYGVTSPVYLNGTHWATPVIDGGLGKSVTGEQPFVRAFMGDAFATYGARLVALPGFTGEAVLFGRNTALRTISDIYVDGASIANVAIDISWVGTASGFGGAAPACFNKITGLYGTGALQKGILLDGQADSLVQNINYAGGNAPVGFSLQLSGGGIWANNLHIHQGRTLISAQNARISDSVLLNGVRVVSSSTDLLEFTSCQFSTDADPDDPNNGYTIYSATDLGSFGTFAINFTSCFFLGAAAAAPVPHKAYFAGRWNTGCNFTACHFNLENYFDTTNWTVNGSGGAAPPVFDFKHCTFFASDGVSPVIPATVAGKVRVGLYAALRGDGLMLARRDFPDDVRLLTSSATEGRIRLKDSFIWADANGFIMATKGTTPSSDADGSPFLQQRRGTGSPLGVITPLYAGAEYYDTTANTKWWALGTTNTAWVPVLDKGVDMASAATVDLATSTGDYVEITGTTTITALGTMNAGIRKTLRFQSALAVTHNATSLIIPGNQNISVSAGNAIDVLSLGSGNWMVTGFSSFGANATFLVAGTVADARLPTTMAGKTLTTVVVVANVNAQVGTTYTLVLADASKVVEMNNAAANTLTVPTNATAAFAVGTVLDIVQTGAGKTTVAAAGGVTINSTGGLLSVAAQWSRATLRKTATDTWVLTGSLIA